MSDPLRTDPSRARDAWSPEPDRTAKIEQLLLDGLDHYFNGQYEQAINIWTRALFIDRNHPRARAYIERARAALAERQRRSEELLHSGTAAFNRGESDVARRLLEDAIGLGAPADEALALLARLERIGPTRGTSQLEPKREARRRSAETGSVVPSHASARTLVMTAVAAGVIAGGAWLLAVAGMESLLPFGGGPAELPPAPGSISAAPPVPVRGELALERARSLAASGRLHDALDALDRVRPTDAQRGEADRLKSELQQQLIEFAPPAESAAPVESTPPPEPAPPVEQSREQAQP